MNYNQRNSHPRDLLLNFDSESHTYRYDGREFRSVTTVVGELFEHFNSDYWAAQKASKLGVSPEQVKQQWEEAGAKARDMGTEMHAKIEKYYLGEEPEDDEDTFRLFKIFAASTPLTPYRTEWSIFDEDHDLAGTLDFLELNTKGEYWIYDWKRSSKLVKDGQLVRTNSFGNTGFGPAARIPDVAYWHYALQLGIYSYILRTHYDIQVTGMKLGVFHPCYDRPYVLAVPELTDIINDILKYLER